MQFWTFLRENPGLKIICLLLSIGLWLMVRYTQSPIVLKNEYQSSLYVPISYSNTEKELSVLQGPSQVLVTIKGAPQVIESAMPSDFRASINLQGMGEGQHMTDVDLKTPPGVIVVDMQPSRTLVALESYQEEQRKVEVTLRGSPKQGYEMSRYKVEPDTVTVSGKKSLMKKVAKVVAVGDLSGGDRDLFQSNQVFALDSDDKRLDVKISPPYVRMDVILQSAVKFLALPVVPRVVGDPAQGFRVSEVKVTPEVLTVQIEDKASFDLRYLNTETIQLNNAKIPVEKTYRVMLPKGVSVLEGENKVKIRISIVKGGI